jgi:hypothetical protein
MKILTRLGTSVHGTVRLLLIIQNLTPAFKLFPIQSCSISGRTVASGRGEVVGFDPKLITPSQKEENNGFFGRNASEEKDSGGF